MKYLTAEEKAKIINIIGLQFVKNDNKVEVALKDDSTLITPYSYQVLASMILGRLNGATNQERCRLRKALNTDNPEKRKIINILQIGKFFKYH